MENSKFLNPKQRRARNREEMTNAILQTARAIMREQGVADLNLNEIARRLSMKTPSLYEYFPNKMALYDQLFLMGVRLWTERFRAAKAANTASWEAVEAFFRCYMEFALDYPELFQLVFERHVPHFEPSPASMNESWAALGEVTQQVQLLVEAEVIRSDLSIDQIRDFASALIHGIVAQHLANEPHLPIGEGRYGALIPAALQILRKAWGTD